MPLFEIYNGDLIGLPTSENHLNFKWYRNDCKVLFSAAKTGDALNIHIASDKRGLPKLETAVKDFCGFCFEMFDWCQMLIGNIEKESVKRLAAKCGWFRVAECRNTRTDKKVDIYILPREKMKKNGGQ